MSARDDHTGLTRVTDDRVTRVRHAANTPGYHPLTTQWSW